MEWLKKLLNNNYSVTPKPNNFILLTDFVNRAPTNHLRQSSDSSSQRPKLKTNGHFTPKMQTSQYTYKYGNHHGPVDSMTQTTPKLYQMGKCVYI